MNNQDKTETILDLTEMLENELRTTYEGIEDTTLNRLYDVIDMFTQYDIKEK